MCDQRQEDNDAAPAPLIGSTVYVLAVEPDRLGYIQLQAEDGSVFQAAIDSEAAANLILGLSTFLTSKQEDMDQLEAKDS